ncbi:MAG: hypothetical protein WAU75_04645 [Solirubrobacteraceae bacterium]
MTTTHRVSTTAVLILSLAAASAPAASARPIGPDVGVAANGQSSAAVRPNPDKQAVTGATANRTAAAAYSRQDKSMVPATSPSTTAPRTTKVSGLPPLVRLQAPGNGFDWGDAGIGAAGGVALSLIGLGGALAVSQRRTRHTTA